MIAIPTKLSHIQEDEISGEVVLYDPTTTRVIYLNPQAKLIWDLIDNERSQVDIVSVLQEVFPGNDSVVLDVNDALNRLEEFGALNFLGE